MVLTIRKYPDKILRQKAKDIENISEDILNLAKDMLETMYTAGGIGLAANQIGIPLKIAVVDISEIEKDFKPIVLVNPEILSYEGEEVEAEEGCLSIPNIFEKVKRSYFVKVKYIDLSSEEKMIEAEGLLARVLQHEIDHLNGILFIDRLKGVKKQLIKEKLNKNLK